MSDILMCGMNANGQTSEAAAERKDGNPLRICILLESYLPVAGGMESQAYELSRSLVSMGAEVQILTRRSRLEFPAREEAEGVSVRRILPPAKFPFSRWFMALNALPHLIMRRSSFDLLFVAGFRTLGLTAVIFGLLTGKKTVLKAESSGELSGDFFAGGLNKIGLRPSSPIVRSLLRWRARMLSRADAFVSLSSSMTDEFVASGAATAKIWQVPNMVDTLKFRPASEDERARLAESLALPPDSRLVIYAGRLVSYKGVLDLVKAWQVVQKEDPGLRLLIVGSGGDDIYNCEAEMREFISALGLEDSVVSTGQVANVHDYLRCSQIFILPSENEALPISIIEAMACRLAVIACPAGGVSELIEDGETGLLIPFRSPGAIAESILRAARDEDLREKIARSAHRKALAEYSPERITARYLEMFRSLDQERSGQF